MTDYNDGEWHGWNGGECPVHPDSIVEVVPNRGMRTSMGAMHASWSAPNNIIVFRVTKQHKEPREFWVGDGYCFSSIEEAKASGVTSIIRVREVTK